jgi:hypothetical protein
MRDTIEMACEAGIAIRSNWAEQELKAFEALVRADERKACAKVCKDADAEIADAEILAERIRARGNG